MRSFLIIGLDHFGKSVACELSGAGFDVIAVDQNPIPDKGIVDCIDAFIVGDFTRAETLNRIGVSKFDAVILGITESFEVSASLIPTLKKLGAPYLVATATTDEKAETLRSLGVDLVIIPQCEAGYHLAEYLADGVH